MLNAHDIVAGPETDKLVHTLVMGFVTPPAVTVMPAKGADDEDTPAPNVAAPVGPPPPYSADVAHAYDAESALESRLHEYGKALGAVLNHDTGGYLYSYHFAHATPLQRCKAALVVVGAAVLPPA